MPSVPKQNRPADVIHQLQHGGRQFRIITSDEEIILRTGEQIVRACQLQINVQAWRQNFGLALDHVAGWCEERKDSVAFALVDLRTEKTVFLLVPKGERFDFDLAENQADLDIYLNTRAGIGYVESRQVPGWEIERFVSTDARRVWPKD